MEKGEKMELVVKKFDELTLDELYEILKVRVNVFVVEQNCPYEEIDEKDKNAYHIYFKDNNKIQAYLRVLEKGASSDEVSIGRVLSLQRKSGLGSKILNEGIKVAKEKFNANKIILEAQTYVQKMYEKIGFKVISDEFLEDGIPHVRMMLEII